MERMAQRLLKFRYEEDDKTLKPQVFGDTEESLSASPSSHVREINMGQNTVINSGNYQNQYHHDGNMNNVGVRHSYRDNAAMLYVDSSSVLTQKSALVETGVQMSFTGSPSSDNIDIAFRNLNLEAYCNCNYYGNGNLYVDQIWYDVSANKATPYNSYTNHCAQGNGLLFTRYNYRVDLRNRLVVANAGNYVAYSAIEATVRNGTMNVMSGPREFSWNRIEINFH